MEFLKSNARFSFVYGERRAFERAFSVQKNERGDTLVTEYFFEKGLKIANKARKYPDFDAYEWVNELENTGEGKTDIISELWDADVSIPFEREEKRKPSAYCPDGDEVTKVFSPFGANVGERDFAADIDEINFNMPDYLFPGKSIRFRNVSGRSSDGRAPFFNVHKGGKGFIAAIGWTGQWNCRIERESDAVFALKNIKKEKDYVFIDMDGGEFTANGAELLRSGLMLHIEEKRKAKIFIYKEK